MPKNLGYILLFDIYGSLLTQKQRETLELYYNDDLSLGEISEESGITRQGVMNCVKISERRLAELEEQLGLAARFSELGKLIGALEERLDGSGLSEEERTEIFRLIREIKEKL
ncbi:MAG: hypothetical protein NC084_00480 [Bacteroides sp.]|nr:DNA-binding protein [Eubacterium sp.]MCM1417215.1 DNA-binding protein [Roseburia sp.]MCM1461164.1 hypothetical protein [Bacteroides sp.]